MHTLYTFTVIKKFCSRIISGNGSLRGTNQR